MMRHALQQLATLGQSVWLDYIRRDLMANGTLRRLIEFDGIKGMTSNPAIFEQAIVDDDEYDADIREMTLAGKNVLEIYDTLSQRDVQIAADQLRSVFESTQGRDGYVSLEVNPHLAHDTRGTVLEGRRLWTALNRPNVMIKVPGTPSGLGAIETLISDGININVTLLFGLPRYQQVVDAYMTGLESRVAQRKPLAQVVSVASFFISRIDAVIDARLMTIQTLQGPCVVKLPSQVRNWRTRFTRRSSTMTDLLRLQLMAQTSSACFGPVPVPKIGRIVTSSTSKR
jgi:transaldolase